MSAKSVEKMVVLVIGLVCVSVGYARADKLQLQEKLSKDIEIQLRDVTIAEAMDKIGQKAGVTFILSDEAVWKLPQGEATRLSVALDGPLAESMTEMLNVFFMRYAVGDEKITIYPRLELEHIIGRPSTKQLELLKKIYSLRIVVGRGVSQDTIVNIIKEGLGGISFLPYDVPRKIHEILEPMGTDEGSLPVTLAVLLEQVGIMQRQPRWYLSGMDFPNQVPTIRIVSEEDFRGAKLNQLVDVLFKDERADVIIQRLANWTGMELFIRKTDPSWLSEKISVNMQNVTLSQALRNVVSTVDGGTDIDFRRRNAISIQGPIHERKPAVPKATRSGDYVGKISIPMDGGKYYIEFMLRESDLTEELKKLRAEKIKEILGEPPKPEAIEPTRSKE